MANDYSRRYAGTVSQRYEPLYDDRQHVPQHTDTLQHLRDVTQVVVDIRDALVRKMATDMPANWAPRARLWTARM